MSRRKKSLLTKPGRNKPAEPRVMYSYIIGGILAFLFIIGAIGDGFGAWNGIRDWIATTFGVPPTPRLDPRIPTPIPAPILSSPAAMSCINSGYALQVRGGMGEIIKCEYTERGLLASVTDGHGNTVWYFWDIANRLIGYSDNQGGSVQFDLPTPQEIQRDDFAFGPTPEGNRLGGINGIFYLDLDLSSSGECNTAHKFVRLYEDGLVLEGLVCSEKSAVDDWLNVSKWLTRDSGEKSVSTQGTYYMLSQNIWFSTTGDDAVRVDYFGIYLDNRLVLNQFYHFNRSRRNNVEYSRLDAVN
jgi:YD repeat-containing protein